MAMINYFAQACIDEDRDNDKPSLLSGELSLGGLSVILAGH